MHGREGQDLLDERVGSVLFFLNIRGAVKSENGNQEFFDAGPPNDPLYPNKWPTRLLPDFQATMEKCYINLQEACLRIMSAIELGLGLEEGKLQARCEPAASEIRLNHYPAVNLSIINKGNLRRTWPHTDFGIITLLFQDLVGGLECEDREKKDAFLAIDPADPRGPSEMVVNISDTLERWTNGLIRAAVHQVDIPPSLKGVTEGMCPDRYSSIFFFKAHRDTSVGPLPEFVTDGRPARYEEITALQFQHQRSSRTRQLY
jgi:isopenicillin N synthase-like dioxygenase